MKRIFTQGIFHLVIIIFGTSAHACQKIPLLHPAMGTWVQELPMLQWIYRDGMTYRVQVSLQVPEQAIYYSSDSLVQGGQWKFPAAASAPLTVAKVLISQNCPQLTSNDLAYQPPSFFVDLRSSCEIKVNSWQKRGDSIIWSANGNPTAYLVRYYESHVNQLKLLQVQQIQQANFELSAQGCSSNKTQIISVQPICNQLKGKAVAYNLCI